MDRGSPLRPPALSMPDLYPVHLSRPPLPLPLRADRRLHLEPARRAACAVDRGAVLRHDPFEPKLFRCSPQSGALVGEVTGMSHRLRLPRTSYSAALRSSSGRVRRSFPSFHSRSNAKIAAGSCGCGRADRGRVTLRVPAFQPLPLRPAELVDDHKLAVDHDIAIERLQLGDKLREAVAHVVAVARVQAHEIADASKRGSGSRRISARRSSRASENGASPAWRA